MVKNEGGDSKVPRGLYQGTVLEPTLLSQPGTAGKWNLADKW